MPKTDIELFKLVVALMCGTGAAALMMVLVLASLLFTEVSVIVAFALLVLAYAAGMVYAVVKTR